jgi:hypothetical protein
MTLRWVKLRTLAVCVAAGAAVASGARADTPAAARVAPERTQYKIQFGAARPVPPPRPSGTGGTGGGATATATPNLVVVEERPSAVSLVKAQGKSVAVAAGETPVLARGELLLSASDTPPKPIQASREGAAAFRLPYEARFVDSAGALRTTEIVTELAGVGLRVVGAAKTFVAELFVKLQDRADPGSSSELPKTMDVLVTGTVDTVAPELLKFSRLGEWQKVSLTSENPADQVTVKLRGSDNVQVSMPIPVLRPKTTLSISPASIQGFGVETAEVTVRVEGLPSPEGRTVVLESTLGRLASTRITLDKDGIGATELRSVGRGVSEVRASSPPLQAADPKPLPFTLPWPFLGFSLFGGALGGTLRFVWLRNKNKRKAKPLDIAAGLLIGLITAGLGVLGFNYTSFDVGPITNELAILLVAACGGLAGSGALVGLAKLKVPGADSKSEG